jgi:hypothetical protein
VLASQFKNITIEDLVGLITNPFKAVLDYARLLEGKKVGNTISLLFNPHRLDTGAMKDPRSIFVAMHEEKFASSLARAILAKKEDCARVGIQPALIWGVDGVYWITEFPPYIMRDLCKANQLTSESRVLDPCAGWGGRMLGASTVVNTYHAFDPSTRTHAGLLKLREFIQQFRPDFKARVKCIPFEDAELIDHHYDFALTSPPYYDTEKYSTESTNSLNRYKSFDDWCDGFYLPMIRKTLKALKPGCPFILNVSSRKYPLIERMCDTFESTASIRRLMNVGQASQGTASHKMKDQKHKKLADKGEQFWELRMK